MPRSSGIQSFSFRPHTHLADEYKEYKRITNNLIQSNLHQTNSIVDIKQPKKK